MCICVHLLNVIYDPHFMCIYNVHVVTRCSIPTTYKIASYTYDYIAENLQPTLKIVIIIINIVQNFWPAMKVVSSFWTMTNATIIIVVV